jgi:predicted RNA binding protein YcfA (HicA-like mRNA interferase family)
MQRADPTSGTVTVPVPDHAELKIGTLLSIVRQTRLPRTAYEVEP